MDEGSMRQRGQDCETNGPSNFRMRTSCVGDLEGCFRAISSFGLKGVGDFFSWQMTCDLMESRAIPKCDTADHCALGRARNVSFV
jgi:hypothetical protein